MDRGRRNRLLIVVGMLSIIIGITTGIGLFLPFMLTCDWLGPIYTLPYLLGTWFLVSIKRNTEQTWWGIVYVLEGVLAPFVALGIILHKCIVLLAYGIWWLLKHAGNAIKMLFS